MGRQRPSRRETMHSKLTLAGLGLASLAACTSGANLGHQSAGTLALTADDKRLLVVDSDNDQVHVLDPASKKVVGAVHVGSRPAQIAAASDGKFYVSNRGSRTVSVVDASSGAFAVMNEFQVGAEPVGLAVSKDGSLL